MNCSSYRSYALFTMGNLLVVIYTGKEIAIIEGKNVNTIFVTINIFSCLGLSVYECKMDTFIITAPYLSSFKPWQYAFWWPIKHIKEVTRDPQAVQVNLPQHKCTAIPPRKKKQKSFKFRQEATKHYEDERKPQVHNKFDPEHTKSDRCNRCGDSLHWEGFRCPVTKHQCKICKKIGHFRSLSYLIVTKGP